MTMLKRRAIVFMPLLPMVLAGCQTTQASSGASSGDVSQTDLDFVTNAINIIRFDRDECSLAQTEATSLEVRAIAAKLLSDANRFDEELQPIVMQAGIKPPTILPLTLRTRAGRLRFGQGSGFDRAFLADQIASHQDALNLQETVMATPGSNPRLTEISMRGTSLVRGNLEQLQALQQRLLRSA